MRRGGEIPVDYMANQNDPLVSPPARELRRPPRDRVWPVGSARADLPNVHRAREPGIAHHFDDWGPKGGHEWPYWHHQMWEYVGAHF
jgi:esterase/lipase superfamily enzyme